MIKVPLLQVLPVLVRTSTCLYAARRHVNPALKNEGFDDQSRLLTRIGAERGGFEPPRPVSQSNGLANRRKGNRKKNQITKAGKGFGQSDGGSDPAVSLPIPYAPQFDDDLAKVVSTWNRLPEAVKAGIVAMVRAATKE
jgi:hypothetical protein